MNLYEEHNCDFKGPEECEEELDDKGERMEKAEEFFGEGWN